MRASVPACNKEPFAEDDVTIACYALLFVDIDSMRLKYRAISGRGARQDGNEGEMGVRQGTCEVKNLGLMIKMVDDAIAKRANNDMRGQGITVMQSRLMLELYGRSGMQMTLKELERSFGVAQATIAGLVSRMEEKGLIETYTNPLDRRAKIARLTDGGVGYCEAASASIEKGERHIRSNLTAVEADELMRLLRVVYDTVK